MYVRARLILGFPNPKPDLNLLDMLWRISHESFLYDLLLFCIPSGGFRRLTQKKCEEKERISTFSNPTVEPKPPIVKVLGLGLRVHGSG